MIDKPIPAKILFTLSNNTITGEEFIGLSGSLYRQNLIFSEPRELRRIKNKIELIITFRDNNSYLNWTKNTEIKEFWLEKFDKLLTKKPKTVKEQDVIIEVDKVKNCGCEKSDFLILQGRSLQFMDELTCNNCFGQVSYSRIPLEIKLEDWQTKHQRIYLNWLDSGLFEEEAFIELTNYKEGKLNRDGETLRKQISIFFNIPVYINYFTYEHESFHSCIVCSQKGIDSGLKQLTRICKTCNTIFAEGEIMKKNILFNTNALE